MSYRREWHCLSSGIHYSETANMRPKPSLPTTDSCPECAVKREEAIWKEVKPK